MVAYCLDTIDMFSDSGKRPRRKRRVMMHVIDAGQGNGGPVINFQCSRCGHGTGWIDDEKSVSENKRGIPCPNCN